jgi:hypothetical protein
VTYITPDRCGVPAENALMKEERLWKERGQETLAIIHLNIDGYLFSAEWKAKGDWKE